MIPRDYITQWRERAPWTEDFQVEQDLVISRALAEIFSNPVLAGHSPFPYITGNIAPSGATSCCWVNRRCATQPKRSTTACRCGTICLVAQGSASSDRRRLRLDAGLSVPEAAAAGYAVRTIHRWDRGETAPRKAAIEHLRTRATRATAPASPDFAFIALFAGKAGAAYARSDLFEAARVGGGMVDLPRGLSRVEGASLASPCGGARELSGRHQKPMLQRGTLRATIVPCGSGTRAFAP